MQVDVDEFQSCSIPEMLQKLLNIVTAQLSVFFAVVAGEVDPRQPLVDPGRAWRFWGPGTIVV